MFKKAKDKPYYTNNYSCFLLTAHLVLVTKYRKPVLQGKVKDYVYAPDIRLSELINRIKSRTARLVRRDYPAEVGEYYWKPLFWTNSYFLGSVGSNTTEIVKEYIQNQ